MEWTSSYGCTGKRMNTHKRTFFVVASLVASMTVGALILMALDQQRPLVGAYSLASYLRLDPVEKVAFRPITAQPAGWNRVEIYYSRTASGNAEDLAVVSHLRSTPRADFHFVVGNGRGAEDGQIQHTDSWKRQRTANGIIRICVVADLYNSPATDYQIRRTTALVDALCRKFGIQTRYIRYPADWQM